MRLSFSIFLLTLIFFTSQPVQAQSKDTVKIMSYNVLSYRNFTSYCTSSNNSTSTKENALEIIIDYTLPDILAVCEMGSSPNGINAFHLMNNALNKNGRSYFQMANYTVTGNSSLTNMLYFNSNKFGLIAQNQITHSINNVQLVRLIDEYILYYKDSNLAQHRDTTYFHFLVAHLKAGNTGGDRTERGLATEAVMAYLDTINATGNYFIMGDFNLYAPNEPAFLDLIAYNPDPSLNFQDPVNRIGNWSNNSSYADVHTQSTRTSGGCGSSGGMDDRFDFILCSDEVINNSDKVRYIPNTYWALGQDGNRFNGNINSPTNNSVPNYVANALYDMSDHLPVLMDLEVTLPATNGIEVMNNNMEVYFNNPIQNTLVINFKSSLNAIKSIEILDFSGKVVHRVEQDLKQGISVDFSGKQKGVYFLKINKQNGSKHIDKLIKI
ncbi:MAG: T9SS type A sorting domain-containing protein [Flavobacteriales bacterium]|nr:T9SS type A sorting domain-containing protein [Flavobacteriales bacterium]